MDVFAGWCGGDMLRTMIFSCLPWSGRMASAFPWPCTSL
jgi:hypothetical protein